MNDAATEREEDPIQKRMTEYTSAHCYDMLPDEVIAAAKLRVIDTLGALVAGFDGEVSRIARDTAAIMRVADGASIIGTAAKVTPEMAAYVNATTARSVDFTDSYHAPGSFGGRPSDVIMPVFAAAEFAHSTGKAFITAVVLAYEFFSRLSDVFHNRGFDHTTFCALATAAASAKLFELTPAQISHCISLAAVPNNILRQTRSGRMSMWKMAASGEAGRAGVFAALLARSGMEGAYLPFTGTSGWCEHIARERFSLTTLGGDGVPFKILDSSIKMRPCVGLTIASVLAAEKIAPLADASAVKRITAEVYKRAKEGCGTGAHHWHPDSRESADHSIPYVLAATLIDGTVTPQSFDEKHLNDPVLHTLMQKIDVVENADFTRAYENKPVEHRARIVVELNDGKRMNAEARNERDDLASPKTEDQIVEKFRRLTGDSLGLARVDRIVTELLHLEGCGDVAAIAPLFDAGVR